MAIYLSELIIRMELSSTWKHEAAVIDKACISKDHMPLLLFWENNTGDHFQHLNHFGVAMLWRQAYVLVVPGFVTVWNGSKSTDYIWGIMQLCLTNCVTSGKFLTWKWRTTLENLWSPFQVWHSLVLRYRNVPHKRGRAFPFLPLPSLWTGLFPLPQPAAFFWPTRLPGPQEPPSGHVKNSLTRRRLLQLLLNLRDYRHSREPSFFDVFT